jgi:hypothetical protein
MMKKLIFAIAILALGAAATVVFAQRQQTNTASVRQRYLPEYTEEGDLILPKNFNEWVYVGSPLTPNALNGGKANFLNITTSTSNQAHTRSTRRQVSSRRERSSSRNCS